MSDIPAKSSASLTSLGASRSPGAYELAPSAEAQRWDRGRIARHQGGGATSSASIANAGAPARPHAEVVYAKAVGSTRLFVGFLFVGVASAVAVASIDLTGPLAVRLGLGHTISLNWARWTTVGVLALIAGACLSSRIMGFLVLSAVTAGVIRCVGELLGEELSVAAVIALAMPISYLMHCSPTSRTFPSWRGMLGLSLVVAAALSVERGWYRWPKWAAILGPNLAELAVRWGKELTWAAVLVATGLGASLTRSRSIHFLTAIVLAAMAYYCVDSGAHVVKTFPELGGASVEYKALSNVEAWRWAAATGLALFAIGLLHMSQGMGAITLMFAVAWMGVGLSLFQSVSTMTAVRAGFNLFARELSNPLGNWGLPIPAPQSVPPAGAASFNRVASSPKDFEGPSPRSTPESPNGASVRRPLPGGVSELELAQARENAIAATNRTQLQAGVSEGISILWMVLTSMLSGMICAAGLSMWVRGPTARSWTMSLLWLAFGIVATVLYFLVPVALTQSVDTWIAWTQSKYRPLIFMEMALGSTAVLSVFSLRHDSRTTAWIHAAIVASFLGTAITLAAVTFAIHFGGFPPLPVWTYCVIAAGQSSIAWILLFHLHGPFARQDEAALVPASA